MGTASQRTEQRLQLPPAEHLCASVVDPLQETGLVSLLTPEIVHRPLLHALEVLGHEVEHAGHEEGDGDEEDGEEQDFLPGLEHGQHKGRLEPHAPPPEIERHG